MQWSIEVLSDGETWLVRMVDADGEHQVRFFNEENARSFEAGQRVRLRLPRNEPPTPNAQLTTTRTPNQ